MSAESLRADALAIWKAGVDAVKPERLFAAKVQLQVGGTVGNKTRAVLAIEEHYIDLSQVRRLVVVGAGKASAAMARELHRHVLATEDWSRLGIEVVGWVNCPEGTFQASEQLSGIRLFAARPAGCNEPTEEAVRGTELILRLVQKTGPGDLVICLLSGGGSALLVAPPMGVRLEDKLAVAQVLAAAGANIEQLNRVRRALSDVKAGGLARACQAPRLVTLIISDVLGDPLQTIASGPTVTDIAGQPATALEVLEKLKLLDHPRLENVTQYLRNAPRRADMRDRSDAPVIEHIILGNNADAVDAAGVKAVELGYAYALRAATTSEGDVSQVAKQVLRAIEQFSVQTAVDCWISGGEPTVRLPANGGGKGGRNQHLALYVLNEMMRGGWPERGSSPMQLAFVSGGTDGEDGPTDAAGAVFDQHLARQAQAARLSADDYLRRADAYTFFNQLDGLIRTGPTGTNVCDLRVALAPRIQ